MIYIWLPSKQK